MVLFTEYIWIDGKNNLRSKTRVLDIKNASDISEFPRWTFDGSSCYLSETQKSDLILVPVKLYNDPFRGGQSKLVLCEVYTDENKPHPLNKRKECFELLNSKYIMNQEPWFGIEQEYVIFHRDSPFPLNWKAHNEPGLGEQGPYYCGIGGDRSFGRQIAEEHMTKCIMAGLKFFGFNSEVMPSQWEYQLGPIEGIDACDQLWISRYILQRVTEKYSLYISFHPKPYLVDNKNIWNGSGGHTNFSTKHTRAEGGIEKIRELIEKMSLNHSSHIKYYGEENEKRLTGSHEAADISTFSAGNSDRTASVRIPVNVSLEKKGYLEDRRPASNMDPYLVAKCICECL